MSQDRVLLVVFDGLGYSRSRSTAIVDEAYGSLPDALLERLLEVSAAEMAVTGLANGPSKPQDVAKLALYPVHAESLPAETPVDHAVAHLKLLSAIRKEQDPQDAAEIDAHVQAIATAHRYVPWAAQSPALDGARNANLSFPTYASGKWAGFEDLKPEVMGNSDTGHQQIGNLWVAPQTALEISDAITSGEFFKNPALVDVVTHARTSGNLNFCFLLSGMGGSDGRVHSSWNHLEAFLELVFERIGLPPDRVRMEAILDGRDSHTDSSITKYGDIGDYLGRLESLLDQYGAKQSLAWVVGRGTAMDRDYREENVKRDYQLLRQGLGEKVAGFAGARAAIAEAHAAGITDHDVPPIVVTHGGGDDSARIVEPGDAFVNLNFRADRQRAKTASLTAQREFLQEESNSRGKPWKADWIEDDLNLSYCGIADYHPDLSGGGMSVAFATIPQAGNFLAMFNDLLPGGTYSLIGESNKSAHVGYFIRGRRENPPLQGTEHRTIVPSAGEESGVTSDTDFFKTPAMRAQEISDLVAARISDGGDLVIACNFSNCDMLGHLLPARFDEAVAAYEALDQAIAGLIRAASHGGYGVILTSDHGNVEEDNPAHSANEILTTIIPAHKAVEPRRAGTYQARLFDIPWTLGTLLGIDAELGAAADRMDAVPSDQEFIGRSLIAIRPDPG